MDLVNPLQKRYYNALMLVSLGAGFLLVAAMFAVIQLHKHVFETHSSAVSITEHIISDITISHLWLEETVAYNTTNNKPLIIEKLNAVSNQLSALRFTGDHTHLLISHQQTDKLQQLHQDSLVLFQQISMLTERRLDSAQAVSTVDTQFNQLSEGFIANLAQIHTILQHSYSQHIHNLDNIQYGLILLAFLVLILAARVVTISLRKQQSYLNQAVESEAHTEVILKHAFDAVVTIDRDSKILSWNKKAESTFGWSEQEAVSQNLVELIIPERYQKQHLAGVKKLAETGVPGSLLETRAKCFALHRDGEEIAVELSISQHILNNQHYFTAFIQNITENLKAEHALKEAEKRLTQAQSMAKIGSWELDLLENKLIWSDEIYHIFEIDKETFGASYDAFLEAIHPEDRDSVNDAYTNSLKTQKPYQIDHRLLMRDGRIKYVRESCESFFDPNGNPVRSVGTVQDISKQVENQHEKDIMNTEMEHMQRLESLGVLAGGIAHDFNNILAVIMTNAELASLQLNEASPVLGHINHVIRASEKASFLCKQMLAYSGKGQYSVEPVILSDLVEEMGQLLSTNIPDNITLHTSLDKSLPAIDADTSQLIQVIMNLILNASEAIGDNEGEISISTGSVEIRASEILKKFLKSKLSAGKYIFLKVSDNGSGMSEETLDHLFEPFFTTKFTGRGLGMSAVLGIVHGHGGDIIVSSEPDKGSQFELYFPYSNLEVPASENLHALEEPKPDDNCILIIDHPLVGKVTSSILKNSDIRTLFAANAKEANTLFEKFHSQISAVLLDVSRPEPGMENMFANLCLIDPEVKIFITSNYNENSASKQIPFINTNLAGFIQKPFAAEELITKISKTFNKT